MCRSFVRPLMMLSYSSYNLFLIVLLLRRTCVFGLLKETDSFFVYSFYEFFVDGGLRTPLYPSFGKVDCSSKITLFCWLAYENKILTLSNLAKKCCNFQYATDTCVICYQNSETADHLLIHCDFTIRIWFFF